MNKIEIAEVLKPQGIKGELKLRSLVDNIDVFKAGDVMFIDNQEFSIESVRGTNEFLYIKFAEISSIQEAEKHRGKFVEVARAKIEENLEEGEYFLSDLIGKTIVFEEGETVGEITDIQNFGSADVFYVLKKNGKEVLFSNVEGVIIEVNDHNVVVNKKRFGEVSI